MIAVTNPTLLKSRKGIARTMVVLSKSLIIWTTSGGLFEGRHWKLPSTLPHDSQRDPKNTVFPTAIFVFPKLTICWLVVDGTNACCIKSCVANVRVVWRIIMHMIMIRERIRARYRIIKNTKSCFIVIIVIFLFFVKFGVGRLCLWWLCCCRCLVAIVCGKKSWQTMIIWGWSFVVSAMMGVGWCMSSHKRGDNEN